MVASQTAMALQHRTFLYGTLKRGQPNHHHITDSRNGKGRFLCDGRTKERYPLVIAGRSNLPFCLNKQGHGQHIKGEIWEIDAKMLKFLDLFEDSPRFYQRLSRVICLEDGREVEAQVYLLSNFKESLLELPCMAVYESEGAHNLPYRVIPLHTGEDGATKMKNEVIRTTENDKK